MASKCVKSKTLDYNCIFCTQAIILLRSRFCKELQFLKKSSSHTWKLGRRYKNKTPLYHQLKMNENGLTNLEMVQFNSY